MNVIRALGSSGILVWLLFCCACSGRLDQAEQELDVTDPRNYRSAERLPGWRPWGDQVPERLEDFDLATYATGFSASEQPLAHFTFHEVSGDRWISVDLRQIWTSEGTWLSMTLLFDGQMYDLFPGSPEALLVLSKVKAVLEGRGPKGQKDAGAEGRLLMRALGGSAVRTTPDEMPATAAGAGI